MLYTFIWIHLLMPWASRVISCKVFDYPTNPSMYTLDIHGYFVVPNPPYIEHCAPYTVRPTLYIIHRTLYGLQCTTYIIDIVGVLMVVPTLYNYIQLIAVGFLRSNTYYALVMYGWGDLL